MSYYQLLEENNDISAFDKKVRKILKIDLKVRAKLYHDLIVENIFKVMQKDIFVTWLTF